MIRYNFSGLLHEKEEEFAEAETAFTEAILLDSVLGPEVPTLRAALRSGPMAAIFFIDGCFYM